MEKPYAALTGKPLAAPSEDMEEIVIATLNGMQFGKFVYVDSPRTIQGTREDTELWGDRPFKSSFSAEIVWRDDQDPPAQFQDLLKENDLIHPLLVTVRVKDLKADEQEDARDLAKRIWNQLKERAAETAKAAKHKKPPTDHGTAVWATVQELDAEGYLEEHSNEDPSTRLLIGSYKNHTISVPTRFTEAHAVVAGPPGVGKSRTIFIPNLIERMNTSAIVTEVVPGEDIQPIVYRMTAGFREANGQKIYYLNPSDLHNSTRFNPIDFIYGIDDAIYYSNLIVANTTEKSHIGDQIWKQSETHLLTSLLLYAWGLGGKQKSKEGGPANLGHIRSLLRYGPLRLNEIINKNGIPESRDRFDEFIRNSSPNFRLGVFSGLIQRLDPWINPKLIKLTEVSDFTEQDLKKQLFTFYLAYPVHREDYKPMMALALNFLCRLPLRQEFDRPLTLLLDEFAAYGHVPGIDNLQATIRNRRIGMLLGFQDMQQLQKVYTQHEADNLFTNTDTKIMFATGSPKTQQLISQILGQETRVKKQVSSTGHVTKTTFGAPLLGPGEVGTRIKDGQVLVIRNRRNPLLADTCDRGKYNAYGTDYPPPSKPKKHIDPAIFDQVELAAQLEFSQDEADQQAIKYEQLWKAKRDAEDLVEQAKQQGLSHLAIKSLEKKLYKAQAAYDKFVAPEHEPKLTTEPVEKNYVLKPSPPEPVPAAPQADTVHPAPQHVSAAPEPIQLLAEDAHDLFEDMYGQENGDDFDAMYDSDREP